MFVAEVTRVAREVGTEGTWKVLTDNVNVMAANVGGCFVNFSVVRMLTMGLVDASSAHDRSCNCKLSIIYSSMILFIVFFLRPLSREET